MWKILRPSAREGDKQFSEEAQRIFESLHLEPETRQRYHDLDAIYRNPETGGTVYVGNKNAASNWELLQEKNIKRVVNCTTDLPNYFSEEDGMEYFQFRIAGWMQEVGDSRSNVEILAFSAPVLDFIDTGLENGESVLVHCLAGAHRAGTTGVLVLMHKLREPYNEALLKARLLRPIINPIGLLKLYAEKYSRALIQSSTLPIPNAEPRAKFEEEEDSISVEDLPRSSSISSKLSYR